MSMVGGIHSNSGNMGSPIFHELKKQASFFFKEKIKTARLALTDVTPAQLLTEEATNANPWAPDTRTLKTISRAAFEVDDYWRIVEILHKRLAKFDRNNWRLSYNALIVLEHLLTHGPESTAEEFQSDRDVIREMGSFQYIDEKGFNWGLNVRKKSERILQLLEKGPLLKEERDRARKLTRGIQGFGSFSHRASSAEGILQESSHGTFGRSNSQFNENGNQEEQISSTKDENLIEPNARFISSKKIENSQMPESSGAPARLSFKENMAPDEELLGGESGPLLRDQEDDCGIGISTEADHPFHDTENQATVSLLSRPDQLLQAY
ncbi:epsin-3 [Diospyros lotus]|uniref:epsin-3 n=1 Tax=Diospyros lotus TaxID=55363 RepID=UPI00225B976C|nr:epsin-3 [Diospyros lotus]